MGGFLMTGLWVVIGAIVLSLFFQIPGLQLAISAAIIMIMSGLILYDTSQIINGGETNYIMATVSLYLSIYNIFQSLLILIGFSSSD
jgi:modulator of FtsH protease